MMIGTGIFSTGGSLLKSLGSPGLVLLFWVLGLLIALSGLAVYLEFTHIYPSRAGGEAVWLGTSGFPPRSSTLVLILGHFSFFLHRTSLEEAQIPFPRRVSLTSALHQIPALPTLPPAPRRLTFLDLPRLSDSHSCLLYFHSHLPTPLYSPHTFCTHRATTTLDLGSFEESPSPATPSPASVSLLRPSGSSE